MIAWLEAREKVFESTRLQSPKRILIEDQSQCVGFSLLAPGVEGPLCPLHGLGHTSTRAEPITRQVIGFLARHPFGCRSTMHYSHPFKLNHGPRLAGLMS
jgi:hypothetical protein